MSENAPILVREQKLADAPIALTVAIPAYRHEAYVTECLSGILAARKLDRIEILLLDDCSPDATLSRAREVLEASGARFRLFHNPVNRGLTYGLRFLLEQARGRYFLPCASDDSLVAAAIDQLVAQIDDGRITEAFLVCAADYFGSLDGPVYAADQMTAWFRDIHALYRQLSTEYPKPLLLQSTIFDTAFLRHVAPWDDGLGLDDWPSFIRATRRAIADQRDVSFAPDIVLTLYRVHAGGNHNNIERQRHNCLQVVDQVVDRQYGRIARSNVLSDIAAIHLFEGRYRAGFRDYALSVQADPSFRAVFRLPMRAARSLLRRQS